MIAQIILLKRMPPNITYFDYSVPKNLENNIKIGQLVEVPFRTNKEYGLVYSLNQNEDCFDTKIKLRSLNEICFTSSFLPQSILNFLQEISYFYATDLGFIYKFSLPKFTKKFLAHLTYNDLPEIENNYNNAVVKPQVVIIENRQSEQDFLQKKLLFNGQQLILVPEKNDLIAVANYLKDIFPIKIFSSDLSNKEVTKLWQKIRRNENVVVIGTRKALFLPWINLKNIFILDEGNENYKSFDMAPRYHTRDAALFLSSFTGSQVYLISHSPSVSSYYFAEQKKYSVFGELDKIKKDTEQIKVIDLNIEKHAKNYSLLSIELLESLKKLDRIDSAFLFLNKKGTAGYVFCKDCKNPLVCSNCKRPLSYFSTKKEMRCNFCGIVKPAIGSCPNCQSFNLKMYNPGTEGLEKELRRESELKHFQIVRLDSEIKNLFFEHKPGTIYVGTELAWGLIPWPQIKLIGFVNTDISLISAEYKKIEHLWQKIRDSFYKSNDQTKIILQTSYPNHYLFSALNDPVFFYKNQLQERLLFQYPPFSFWLKLAISLPNEGIAIKEANELKNHLLLLTNTLKIIKISGPHQATPFLYKGQYRYILLVRLNYENYRYAVKEINKLIPKKWKVDPNPNTLLTL